MTRLGPAPPTSGRSRLALVTVGAAITVGAAATLIGAMSGEADVPDQPVGLERSGEKADSKALKEREAALLRSSAESARPPEDPAPPTSGLAAIMGGTMRDKPLGRLSETVLHDPFGVVNLQTRVVDATQARQLEASRSPQASPVQRKSMVSTTAAPGPLPTHTSSEPIAATGPSVAPPLPFVAIGGLQSPLIAGGTPAAFVRLGDDVLVVREGDEVNRTYRVDSVSRERIVWTYLPLGQQQILNLSP